MPMPPQDTRAQQAVASNTLYASLAVNLVLMALQILIGHAAHSDGLLADGVHTLVDLMADAVILLAFRHGALARRAHHADASRKLEAIAALGLGLLLIGTGSEMLWRAAEHIGHVSTLVKVDASALGVAIFALIAKEVLFRCMVREAKRTQSALLHANAWHARSDAISSLLVLVGIAASQAGFAIFDQLAAALVGLMVLRLGSGFAWTAWRDALGQRAGGSAIQPSGNARLKPLPAVGLFAIQLAGQDAGADSATLSNAVNRLK